MKRTGYHFVCRFGPCTGGAPGGSRAGYTLLDFMIVVALIVVVGMVAIPNIVGKMPEFRLDGAAGAVNAELRAARMLARSGGRDVEVSVDGGGGTLSVQSDRNGNGTIEADEVSVLDLSQYHGVSIGASASNGVFNARGTFTCTGGNMKISLTSSQGDAQYVYVFAGGIVERTGQSL
jgi:type II secretory pathway pseudopilin PulG